MHRNYCYQTKQGFLKMWGRATGLWFEPTQLSHLGCHHAGEIAQTAAAAEDNRSVESCFCNRFAMICHKRIVRSIVNFRK